MSAEVDAIELEQLRKDSAAFRSLVSVVAGSLEVSVPIRENLNATARVPRDLTTEEAQHIALVLLSLVRTERDIKPRTSP